MTANISGCIALVDGDQSPTSCAAKHEASVSCAIAACLVCPGQYLKCMPLANATVCKMYASGSQCGNASKYAQCQYSTLDTAFKGLGRLYCAGGLLDGGASDAATD